MPGWSEYTQEQLYATLKQLDAAKDHLDATRESLKAAGCPMSYGPHSAYAEITEYIQERKDLIHRLIGSQLAEKFAKAENK